MKRIDPERAPRRRRNLTLTDRDWEDIFKGGKFELVEGKDFQHSINGARDELRRILNDKFGKASISVDEKNGTLTLTITPPQPS